MAGGVHGANRLGGSSLLGCVVYGRVAGATSAAYHLNQLSAARRVGGIASHVAGVPISLSIGGVNVAISFGDASAAPSVAPNASAPSVSSAPAVPEKKTLKEYTLADVAQHKTDKDCWVVVNGQVLDVTSFLDDHPVCFFL